MANVTDVIKAVLKEREGIELTEEERKLLSSVPDWELEAIRRAVFHD